MAALTTAVVTATIVEPGPRGESTTWEQYSMETFSLPRAGANLQILSVRHIVKPAGVMPPSSVPSTLTR